MSAFLLSIIGGAIAIAWVEALSWILCKWLER